MTQPGNGNIGQLNNNETRAEHRAARRRPPRANANPAMPMPPARPRWAPERDPLGCALFFII